MDDLNLYNLCTFKNIDNSLNLQHIELNICLLHLIKYY